MKDGTERMNPYRNQIEFILVKTDDISKVTDSRSFAGTSTFSDHRMVRMSIRHRIRNNKKKYVKPIDFGRM